MKKTPLRYIVLFIVSVAVVIVSISALMRVFVNKKFVAAYDKGIYFTTMEQKLFLFNFPEGYIPLYNVGNAAYMNEDYLSAISYYTDALKYNPGEPQDCMIRINLALALIHTIDFDNLDSDSKVQDALSVLYQARGKLTQNGCAEEDGENGHNKDAQQLKDDIDKMIEKLQKDNPDNGEENKDQNDSNEDEEKNESQSSSGSNKQKQQQQALEQNKKNAMQERQEEIDQLDEYQKNTTGSSDGSGMGGAAGDEEGDGSSQGPTHPW